jgi:hypothetical protein
MSHLRYPRQTVFLVALALALPAPPYPRSPVASRPGRSRRPSRSRRAASDGAAQAL